MSAEAGRRVRGRTRAARALALVLCLLTVLGLAACAPADRGWADRPQAIAGGGATGVYYAYGQRFAAALSAHLGATFTAQATNGSVDNLERIGAGTAVLGFAQGDAVADAVAGTGAFSEPLPIVAVARLYDEYVHIVVRAGSDVHDLRDLAGRAVSLGARGSGVDLVARRILGAADVDPAGIRNPELGLEASIGALRRGEIDGFFWVGGLPTPGIATLAADTPIRLLSIPPAVVDAVNAAHAGAYRQADFPVGAYGIDASTVTMTVPNYLVTRADAPEGLIHDATAVLFEQRGEIARGAPAAALLDRRQAIFTDPIALHDGAVRYYRETHD
ncbi:MULTISPECIES: TAXI family TRAP transporter solute-binding subunit [unclassified Microbacterium]|uniref:TAXI family TRAP transporter solute-binding subunit n=1 Tax=unclassified Microbacterium TaxID=2609290 RepID=UPI001AD2CD5F|nr:TAXI family TRAP transporter solute-binding subunit [Microbacterium sp.]MBN9159243.1 TAXI family TRAP transporter solute-binding subunit [Microbacterium sp.]MBS1895947.1 TAXI family TRAP transporter solute-binding subunit [Actinomycetota bacterium]